MTENTTETIAGGRKIEVTTTKGELSKIKIRRVSHLKASELVLAYEDDLRMAMLVTGKDESQLKEYDEESFFTIVDAGHEVNEKTINRAMKSRAKKLRNPDYQEYLKSASSLSSSLLESDEKS